MDNLRKFLNHSDELKKSIGVSIKSCWYRGQSNPWPLNCSLARYYNDSTDIDINIDKIHSIEESLYCDFSQQADGYNNGEKNSWDLLAAMQHYGVPTRMLDWTESFLVACYFALEESFDIEERKLKPGYEPTIYFLNPYKLSASSKRSDSSTLPESYFKDSKKIWNVTLSQSLDYMHNIVLNRNWHFESPLPIFPPKNNSRIIAQQGCFTVHGLSMAPLDEQGSANHALKKVSIREHKVARELWHMIELHNISEYYIYRDLDRLGNHLRNKHKPMPNKSMQPTAKASAD